jgi:preprotein translocase subunit SecG
MGFVIVRSIMYLVEFLVSLLLIVVILLQRSKTQGSGMAFGAAMGETLFGSQAGNFLSRTTVVLAVIFLLNTTILAMISSKTFSRSVVDSIPVATAPARQQQPPQVPGGAPMGAQPASLPGASMPMGQPMPAGDVPMAQPVAAPAAPVVAPVAPVAPAPAAP